MSGDLESTRVRHQDVRVRSPKAAEIRDRRREIRNGLRKPVVQVVRGVEKAEPVFYSGHRVWSLKRRCGKPRMGVEERRWAGGKRRGVHVETDGTTVSKEVVEGTHRAGHEVDRGRHGVEPGNGHCPIRS